MKEKLLLSLTTVQEIYPFQTWQSFSLFSCTQTLCQFFSQWTKVSLEALKHSTKVEQCVCYAEHWRKVSFIQRLQCYKQWRTLADSWKVVTKETFINCFNKTGINSDIQQAAIANSDYPFKEIRNKFIRA